MKVVVVGSGIGGLCAAIRLRAADHHVVVLERNPFVGGKVAEIDEGGYRFDVGPTSLTLPQVFDEVFRLAGSSLSDEVDLVRLDPQCRFRWPNGSTLDMPDDPAAAAVAIEAFSPGSGAAWTRFADHARSVWESYQPALSAERVVASESVLGRASSKIDVGRVDGRRTLAKASSSFFDDPRLQQLVNRAAVYSGSSPYKSPATLAYLAHVEQAFGQWHVTGGTGRVRDALHRAAERMGVVVRTGVDVGRIAVAGGAVAGVELADGGAEGADVVVANVDAAHLYTDLVPSPKEARQLDKATWSRSAFVLCAAVRGRTDGIAHHNTFFSLHDEQEYRFLDAGQIPIDHTIHATVSSVTDAGMAPPGCENWRISVVTPNAVGIDRKLMSAAVLNRLAERGVDIRQRIEFTRTMLPADFDARYRAPGGALHGPSFDGTRGGVRQPSNLGPVDGLYLVGGSTHPGPGLPMVATSAAIVADLVAGRQRQP